MKHIPSITRRQQHILGGIIYFRDYARREESPRCGYYQKYT
jgi:hypothetical protein